MFFVMFHRTPTLLAFHRKLCGNNLMPYLPKFTITSNILGSVGKIDAAREVINHAPLVPAWERRFRTEARAKIIHHGTHLEGNNLNLDEVEKVLDSDVDYPKITGRDRDIQEVINYRSVMDYIDNLSAKLEDHEGLSKSVTEQEFKEIHRLTLNRLGGDTTPGEYRTVKVVIRNTTTGEITFRPPSPLEVPLAISDFFHYLNSKDGKSVHPLLRAGILHYELVRIHPFTDGNGRATRAMSLLLLFLEGYEIKKFFSLEEYYDQNPGDYYEALKSVEITGDLTAWLEYFILGIAIEFNRVKELVQKLSLDLKLKSVIGGKQIALSDRQIKLVEFIERHGALGMKEGRDVLSGVSEDTVLRDLRDLVSKKLILKKGNTKGAKYYLKNN